MVILVAGIKLALSVMVPRVHNLIKGLHVSTNSSKAERIRFTVNILGTLFVLGVVLGFAEEATAEGRLLWSDVDVNKDSDSTSSALGKRVYEARCVLCHGKDGNGNGASSTTLATRPRDFTSGIFKLRSTLDAPLQDDLYRSVTVGFPAYGMPSFDYLSPRQRWAVAKYVMALGIEGAQARFAQEESPETRASGSNAGSTALTLAKELFAPSTPIKLPKPPTNRPPNLEHGRTLYTSLGCNTCHGDEGKGDGFAAEMLVDGNGDKVIPLDLTGNRWQYKRGTRPRDIVHVLLTGIGGSPMPAFFEKVELHEELWDLAAFVESLSCSPDGVEMERSTK